MGTRGACNVSPLDKSITGVQQYKMVMYHMDAGKCDKFIRIEETETDMRQNVSISSKMRGYRDYEEKPMDVSIDPENVKDERSWG